MGVSNDTGTAVRTAQQEPRGPQVTGIKSPVVQVPKQTIVWHETKGNEEVTKILKMCVKPIRNCSENGKACSDKERSHC